LFITFSAYKTTTILLDGKRVKLQLWDTSGQGRFCTIIRSYSRGAQGILLVYDITNKWSFDGIDRWLKEVEEVSDDSRFYLIGPLWQYVKIYLKTLMLNFTARTWCTKSTGWQSSALGFQETSRWTRCGSLCG